MDEKARISQFVNSLFAKRNELRRRSTHQAYYEVVGPVRRALRDEVDSHRAECLLDAFERLAKRTPRDRWPILSAALIDEFEAQTAELN
ncbi:MAG: hypothetical protein JNG90_19865 [Planctomycetaceae bacterium]|nr:hypothetical protein [Planctomycetaceae bacterium]